MRWGWTLRRRWWCSRRGCERARLRGQIVEPGMLPRSMASLRFALLLWAWLAMSSVASAQGEDRGVASTLSWTRSAGAEACPTVVQVATELEALLGRSVLVDASVADRIVEVSVAPGTDAPFVARIQVSTPTGEVLGLRELQAHRADCSDLLEGASMAIALMIDPDALARTPDEEEEEEIQEGEEEEEEEEDERRPPPVEAPVMPPAPSPPTRFSLDVGGAATFAVGPFVSGAGYTRALLSLPGFVPFGVLGMLQPFSRAEAMGGAVDFLTVLGGVTICPLYFHGPRFSVEGCAGVDLGGALVVGNARTMTLRENERFLVQLDVQAAARVVLVGPLALNFLAALLVPFRNDAWLESDSAVFFSPEPVGAMVGLGVSLDLTLAGDPSMEQHLP